MIAFSRGDVVLLDFVFSDESGRKRRPALVVSSNVYHTARQEAVIAAITSNVTRPLFGDHRIVDWRGAGLVFPSTVTGIIRTIKQSAVDRRLGSLAAADLEAYGRILRSLLDL